jgi:hypothetical protein
MEITKKKDYNINLSNIKYFTFVVINNEPSIWETLINSLSSNYEHLISNTDSLVIEFESELIDLAESVDNENIECKFYSYGIQPFLPKRICSKDKYILSRPLYLSLIESELDKKHNKYKLSYLIPLFSKYNLENKTWQDESYYNCVYYNIYTENISFGICKFKYSGEKTSKYIIAYDTTILDKTSLIIILKNIFIKK